jgi:hypothetical protein
MLIQCKTPLAVGYIQDDTFKVNIKMSTPEDKAKTHHHQQSSVYNVRSLSVEQRASLTMYRLGLASPTRIIDMVNNDLATGLLIPKGLKPTDFDLTNTEASMIAKSKAQPHKDLNMKKSSSAPFELIHVDIEVINIPSYGGSIYSLTIKDDFSNWETKIPLAKKSDLYNAIRKFIAQEVESQGWKVRRVRWDNAKEQKNRKIDDWLTEIKARPEWTSPYSSESNGKAEKSNQDIRVFSNTLRLMARLPKKAWAETDNTACYLKNRLPCRSNPGCMSPFQMLHDKVPDLGPLTSIRMQSVSSS